MHHGALDPNVPGIRRDLSVEVVSHILGEVTVPMLKYRLHRQVDSLRQEVVLAERWPSNADPSRGRTRDCAVGKFGGQTTTD